LLCSMHARSVRRERRAASVCVQYPVFADRPVNVWKVAQSPAIGELVVRCSIVGSLFSCSVANECFVLLVVGWLGGWGWLVGWSG